MGMIDRVPQVDLDRLANGSIPPGIPLDDTEVIFDWCKRWVSLTQNQREGILNEVRPKLFNDGEDRRLIVNRLALKHLTELSDPLQGWRRLTNEQICRVIELIRITPIH